MNRREAGFLLLSSHLGDPAGKPLSPAQLRTLAQRIRAMERPAEDRELSVQDFLHLGYSREMTDRILQLLSREEQLSHYIRRGQKAGCEPITRISGDYPQILRHRLGTDAPGCLWARGDVSLLNRPAVALVGSRDLLEENRQFARAVGIHAAKQGLVLVSGNARGADKTAQQACLEAGGQVISVVADGLAGHPLQKNLLYLSEDGFDEAFSAQRAISRNRCIHALGQVVFVAQASLGKGGTWDGTVKNLRSAISPVLCFRDGSAASLELEQMGAYLITSRQLEDFENFAPNNNFLDR